MSFASMLGGGTGGAKSPCRCSLCGKRLQSGKIHLDDTIGDWYTIGSFCSPKCLAKARNLTRAPLYLFLLGIPAAVGFVAIVAMLIAQ